MWIVRNVWERGRFVVKGGPFYVARNATEKERLAKTALTAKGMVRRNASHVAAQERHDDSRWFLPAFYKL